MKTVYFVRHGTTEQLDSGAYQLLTTPLSGKGVQQAAYVATRFKNIPIDVVIGSTMARAAQTAEIIAKQTEHTVIETDLFREILRPSEVRGKLKNDPMVAQIIKKVEEFFADNSWRHSDEENFFDLKQRAVKALEFLLSRSEQNILVVTHGTFLKVLMSVMMAGESTSHELFKYVDDFMYPSNTGITKCQHDTYDDGRWILLTWNDHEHLGEVK